MSGIDTTIKLMQESDGSLRIVRDAAIENTVFEKIGYLGRDSDNNDVFLAYSKVTHVVYYYFDDSDTYVTMQAPSGEFYVYDEELDKIMLKRRYSCS